MRARPSTQHLNATHPTLVRAVGAPENYQARASAMCSLPHCGNGVATLAVGAIAESSGATGIGGNQSDNAAAFAGAVYVFTRSGATWSQQAYVKASNTDRNDEFGSSVVLSADGSTLVVSAMDESSAAAGINGNQSDNSAGSSGAAYVFTRSGTVWSQQAYVKASNPGMADFFGKSIALSSDGAILAVGAFDESSSARGINGDQDNDGALYSGAVYVFTRSGTVWSQQKYVKPSNTSPVDLFGSSVALSSDGSILVGGASGEPSGATGINGNEFNHAADRSGAVYVYQ